MAAVHIVINIPTEKEENRIKLNCNLKSQSLNTPTTSVKLFPEPRCSTTADLLTPILTGVRYGTFSSGEKKSETKTTRGGTDVGGDIVNEAVIANRLDIEEGGVNRPSMQTSWEREVYREMMASTHSKTEKSRCLNRPPDTCMEIVLKEILVAFQIDNAVWTMDNSEKTLQVMLDKIQLKDFISIVTEISFTMDYSEKYETLIEELNEWGIGDREGSTVSVMNCVTFIKPPQQENHDGDLNRANHNAKEGLWHRFMNSVRSRLNVAQIVCEVRQDATITFDFIILVVSAAILASFGLVEDSSIFLASSMLISPLMGPIIAAIFGTVIKDHSLRTLGLVNELLGVLLATIVGFIFGLIVCSLDNRYGIGEGLTNEMLTRCELHSLLVGVFTALASGAAAAVGVLGGNIGSLVGVAISASLLPPAVNTGLLWALACLYRFYETDSTQYNVVIKSSLYSDHQATELVMLGTISMCLTISNVICVYVMGVIVLKIKEIAPAISRNHRQFWKHDIKLARDLNRRGFDADASIAENLSAFVNKDQRIFGLNATEPISIKGADKLLSYQNTWSGRGNCHQYDTYQISHNYCTVPHFDETLSSTLNNSKSSSKLKNQVGSIRHQKSRSIDLGQYQLLGENNFPQMKQSTQTPAKAFNDSCHIERRRNFIVTPACDQMPIK